MKTPALRLPDRFPTRVLAWLFPHEEQERGMAIVVAVIWLVVLTAGVGYALVQPVWSVVDEGPHFGYVELLAEHAKLPRAGDTVVSEKVLAIGRDRQWGWQYPRDPALVLEAAPPPAELPERDISQWVRENLWRFNYEAVQPPAYYMLAAVAYRLTPGPTLVKVYAVRVLSVFLASLAVVFSYRVARRTAPGSKAVLIGAPMSFLALQGYLLNNSQVTNDSLAAPMGGVLALLLLYLWQEGPEALSRGRLLVGGTLVGLALLTKSVVWYMAPLLVSVLFLRCGVRAGFRKVVVAGASCGALFAPWLVRNLLVYGEATGQSRMARFLGAFFPAPRLKDFRALWEYAYGSCKHMVLTYIWGEPAWVWANRPFNQVLALLAWTSVVVGTVLWYRRVRPRVTTDPAVRRTSAALALLVTTILCGAFFMLVLPLFGGVAVVGRYMYPASAAIAVVSAFGISNTARRPSLKVGFVAALLSAFLVANLANLAGWNRTGRTTSRVADGLTYLEPVSAASTTWLFAPGRNEGGFVDLLYLFNPDRVAATVDITYFPGGRTTGSRRVVVMPREGVTINTRFDRGGGYGAGNLLLGVAVESDVPVYASRGSFFFVSDRPWTGGTITTGSPRPVTEAFFPAGRSGEGYSEILSFLNPSDREVRVSIQYLADGRSVERTVLLSPRSPLRVDASSPPRSGGLGEAANYLSVVVRASEPVVVQRQLYYAVGGVSGGDYSWPVPATRSGVFPAVLSRPGYEPTLVALNTGVDSVKLRLRYLFVGGGRLERELTVPPGRTDVDLDVPFGGGVGVSADVYALEFEASSELALELETLVRDGAFSDAFIEPPQLEPLTAWTVPFATTNPDFQSKLILYNPSGDEAVIQLWYVPSRLIWLPSAQNPAVHKAIRLAPQEVRSIDLRDDPDGVSSTQDFAIEIVGDRSIYVGGSFFFVHAF